MPNYILTCATFDTPEIAEIVKKIFLGDISIFDHEILDFIVSPKEWEEIKKECMEEWDDEEAIAINEWDLKLDHAWCKLRDCFSIMGRFYEFWDFLDEDDEYGEKLHIDGCKLWTCHGWHPYYEVFEELSHALHIHIILDVDVKHSEWWDNENDPEHVEYNIH